MPFVTATIAVSWCSVVVGKGIKMVPFKVEAAATERELQRGGLGDINVKKCVQTQHRGTRFFSSHGKMACLDQYFQQIKEK